MTKLHITTLPDGAELIRMSRPRAWDWARWCAEPECDREVTSMYGWQEAGAATMIGWRAACSRKHAFTIWQRELEPSDA